MYMVTTREQLLLVVLLFGATDIYQSLIPSQQDVMEDLKGNLTIPRDSPLQNWFHTEDKCNWMSVNCSSDYVTKIRIGNQSLGGSLPATLGYLSRLTTLEVMDNHIGGPLPKFARELDQLHTLNLSNNNFSSIPPEFFSGMTYLATVSLDNNPFLPWNLSSVPLTDSENLETFSAANCSLYGTLPAFSDQTFTNLHHLNFSNNNLTGELRSSLSSATSLVTLRVNDQTGYGLVGSLDFLQRMPDLTQVWLQNNAFSGQIPDGLQSLEDFRANKNLLTGPVPDSMTKTTTLRVVNLGNNLLQGPPPRFGIQVQVDYGMYAMENNSFCSSNPGDRCDPQVDILLDIASHFGYPVRLAGSWKGSNSCSVNQTWAGVTCDGGGGNITALNYTHFWLSGTISPAISSLTELRNLSLAKNNLTGPIPEELSRLPHLQMLDVSYNGLCGNVPNSLINVTVYTGNALINQDCPRSPPSALRRNSSYSPP
ncbi:unnamed protein product [Cuscuta europaea]|uniref:Leucine-rich repeat-containing N-terminal plant-type domain-containing protein n=1 Tax=Cuscuta europaea TaxID=41803 RepID=A0A9P0ZW00_CUSEU|nr:unnamed protein product [Cuscuta europaea]